MLFNDPNDRGRGRLTKPQREQLGSTLAQQGHNPTKELPAEAVLDALLVQAAEQFDAKRGGTVHTDAAKNFVKARK